MDENMARSRNIKPGFFTNDQLVELPFSTRLLFIGLWTIADRAGRLRDRPKKIKMELFPADDLNVDEMLKQLHDSGLILRYESSSLKDDNTLTALYIQVIHFDKHQNPHHKEAESLIPAPDKPEASPVKVGASRADSLLLIPDSLNLIPDSLCADSLTDAKAFTHTGSKSCFVPEDWQPDEFLPGRVRISEGVDIAAELETFRLHEFAQPKSNWQNAWLQWLSRSKPTKKTKNIDKVFEDFIHGK